MTVFESPPGIFVKLFTPYWRRLTQTAERTNTITEIPLDIPALNGDFDAFLFALNPQMRKFQSFDDGWAPPTTPQVNFDKFAIL